MRSEAEIREAAAKLESLANYAKAIGNERGASFIGAHCVALEWVLGVDNGSEAVFLGLLDKADQISQHNRN